MEQTNENIIFISGAEMYRIDRNDYLQKQFEGRGNHQSCCFFAAD